MRIKSLEVQNFKGFEYKKLHFSPQFNVLIGNNGSGKTAILDALAVSMGGLLLGFDGIASRSIKEEEVRQVYRQSGQITELIPQHPAIVQCVGQINDSNTLSWERRLNKKQGKTTRQYAKTIRQYGEQLQKKVRDGEPVVLPLLSYYSTARLWLQKKDKVELVKPGSPTSGYVDCLETASNEKMLMGWIKTMEIEASQRQALLFVLEGLRDAVKNCLEGCESLYFSVQLDGLIARFGNGQTLPAYLLSDGQRTILTMVADIAYRAAVLNSHLGEKAALETPGIVLIDEIDLHLHPEWQRTIVEQLKTSFPKIQFIATSHSPIIIQSLKPGEVINLNDEQIGDYYNKGVEDILEWVMGVANSPQSEGRLKMMEVAREYYRLLEHAKERAPEELERVKARLDELSAPYSDNIAYHAFLEMKREVAGLGDDNASR
ncbi:MAG: AAA family ATPase [Candidatus Parabeggiatoa sp. nov. 3]|nr:MAG: AAA family ATPase [Gammaproteobacteria bacterium]RKZ58146.1 MAG: AAA family ATPase [Gammaproteobacteria bacterium]RKZ87187.1 MAG: AAA family ATPase [Gammaproteobacteria bacterium]